MLSDKILHIHQEENPMKKSTQKLIENFRCNYKVFAKGSDPGLLEQAYRESFEAGRREGFCPAIILLDEAADGWLEYMEDAKAVNGSVRLDSKDNGKELLEERFDLFFEDSGYDSLEDFIGEETEGEVIHHFIAFISTRTNKLEEDTLLLEIPVSNPWDLISYLPMGGWNDCPDSKEMTAICKYWYEKYQAVPAVFANDILEFYAPAKLNGQNSIEAAKEHYAFCPDRIDQGTETYTLSELASGLEESDVWYFWWD